MRFACVAVVTAALLGGCGGGVSFGWQFGDGFDDGDPSVELVADRDSGAPGDTVVLIAAASDDSGIDRVTFYRLRDGGGESLLGSDTAAPYRFSTALPAVVGTVRYFARATDNAGRQSDSDAVSVTVVQ